MLLSVVLVALLSSQPTTSTQQVCPGPELFFDFDDPAVAATNQRLWAETTRILRLPDRQRALQVAHVYRDIFSALHPRYYPLANWHVEPDGGLDYFRSRSGASFQSPYLSMYAQQASLALLAAYPREAQPLIQLDLRSNTPLELERGIFVAGRVTEARFPDLYDDLKNIFLGGRECSEKALGSLFRYAGFPRDSADRRQARIHELLPVLTASFQKDPAKYASYLRDLLSVRPAPAELLAALESNDLMLREYASVALRSNTDPRLVPYVFRMLTDPNPRIRLNGFHIGLAGLRRKDSGFRDVKPALEALMHDPDWTVQLDVLDTFAFAGDPVCAPVLLDVLRKWAAGDPSVPDKDFQQLTILAEAIAHRKFGFGSERQPARQDPATMLAIDRFSDWVKTRKP